MSVGSGMATVVSKAVAEAVTVVAVVSVSIGISIGTPLSTGAINCALEAQTVGGGPCRGEATGANKGVSVGEKAMAVVAIVGVCVSLCAPLSIDIGTSSIDGGMDAVSNSSGPAKLMAVVAVVGVGFSLWGSKCKCHQAGDDLGGMGYQGGLGL